MAPPPCETTKTFSLHALVGLDNQETIRGDEGNYEIKEIESSVEQRLRPTAPAYGSLFLSVLLESETDVRVDVV
jgi:hypothetical protein